MQWHTPHSLLYCFETAPFQVLMNAKWQQSVLVHGKLAVLQLNCRKHLLHDPKLSVLQSSDLHQCAEPIRTIKHNSKLLSCSTSFRILLL